MLHVSAFTAIFRDTNQYCKKIIKNMTCFIYDEGNINKQINISPAQLSGLDNWVRMYI